MVEGMPSELNATSPDPLYQQVMDDIKRDIASGLYRSGDQIPTEIELGDIYRVSRITVRRAIKELVDQKLLIKRQGRGTFVNARTSDADLFQNESVCKSFTDTCKANGVKAGASLVFRGVVSVNEAISEFLGTGSTERALQVKRIRTGDGRPIMVEDNFFEPVRFSFLMDENLEDNSIYDLIREHTGLIPDTLGNSVLSMGRATPELSKLLQVPVNEPLFLVAGNFVGQHGEPIYSGIQYIVGKYYSFRL